MAIDFTVIYNESCRTCEEVLARCQCPNHRVQLEIFKRQCQNLLIENVELQARLAMYEPLMQNSDD